MVALHSMHERVWCLKEAKALTLKKCPGAGNGDCYYRAVAMGLVIALCSSYDASETGWEFA